jgi:hypothetical protein
MIETVNDWQRKADALARLAEDQKGKPEGEVAARKLKEIRDKHLGNKTRVNSTLTELEKLRRAAQEVTDFADANRNRRVPYTWASYQASVRDITNEMVEAAAREMGRKMAEDVLKRMKFVKLSGDAEGGVLDLADD